jgi:hypothetical protein
MCVQEEPLPSSHALAARGWMQPNLVDHSGYVTSHTYTPSSLRDPETRGRKDFIIGLEISFKEW